jgi:predicted dehydrogenase
LFGEFLAVDGPAISLAAVHHLCKRVDGRPLRRPAWYYDVAVQGDGVVDVQSHLTDQAQWLVAGERDLDYRRDVRLLAANRGETEVDLDLFRESTGATHFPDALAGRIEAGILRLACNSSIDYELAGVPVRQRVEWRAREPEQGGDQYEVRLRGSRCDVTAANGPDTGYRMELYLVPRPGVDLEAELARAVAAWESDLPDLRPVKAGDGFKLAVPDALVVPHDRQFPLQLGAFLDALESGRGWRELQSRIRLRYTLLARAREMALATASAASGRSTPS